MGPESAFSFSSSRVSISWERVRPCRPRPAPSPPGASSGSGGRGWLSWISPFPPFAGGGFFASGARPAVPPVGGPRPARLCPTSRGDGSATNPCVGAALATVKGVLLQKSATSGTTRFGGVQGRVDRGSCSPSRPRFPGATTRTGSVGDFCALPPAPGGPSSGPRPASPRPVSLSSDPPSRWSPSDAAPAPPAPPRPSVAAAPAVAPAAQPPASASALGSESSASSPLSRRSSARSSTMVTSFARLSAEISCTAVARDCHFASRADRMISRSARSSSSCAFSLRRKSISRASSEGAGAGCLSDGGATAGSGRWGVATAGAHIGVGEAKGLWRPNWEPRPVGCWAAPAPTLYGEAAGGDAGRSVAGAAGRWAEPTAGLPPPGSRCRL